jgi:putative membrane protein
MLGSLRKVWPWKIIEPLQADIVREINFIPTAFNSEVLIAILLMAAGIVLVLVIEYFAERTKPETA